MIQYETVVCGNRGLAPDFIGANRSIRIDEGSERKHLLTGGLLVRVQPEEPPPKGPYRTHG